ncbi:MAG: hypothetical protein KAU89_00905 [Candidatus Thorarchaeota archaeon]|jgi:hypothetical protein|nr:hypothetical protein [Candidatus Thorarchaeota archaeon]
MRSVWFSKKAFFYFGGAFIIILGGAIVYSAPYHATGYIALPGKQVSFSIWDEDRFYPQLEVWVSVQPSNITFVNVDISVQNNKTLDVQTINMTLTAEHRIPDSNPPIFEDTVVINLDPGNYTLTLDRLHGTGIADIGLTQLSDMRIWVVTGGTMNIVGLIMGVIGFFLPGRMFPTGDESIVEWGYEEEEEYVTS